MTTSPLFLAKNQKMQLIQVAMNGQPGEDGPNAAVTTLRADTDAFLKGSGLRGQLTGSAAISVDQAASFNRAEKIISIATVLLILCLLALVFRSVIIAFLPLVVVGLVHQMASSLTACFAQWFGFSVSTELAPLLIVVMFGVGTDYIVFLLFRYREQLAKGQGPHESLMVALCRAGEVIASAAITVMLAFAALLIATIGQLRSLAPGLIIGVGLMLLAALTLVPAILSLFGAGLFWPTTPKPHDPAHRTRSERMGAAVAKRPGIVLLTSVVILVALASGVLNLKVTYNQLAELPQNNPSTEAYNTISSAFPAGFLGPSQVFVSSSSPLDPTAVDALAAKLAHTQGVAQILPVQYTASKDAALIEFLLSNDPYSNQAIADVAGPIRTAIDGSVPGATVVTGGPTATLADVKTALKHDTRNILLLALLVVAVMLAILLRALAGAAYLLIGILLTYVATLGVVAYIFISWLGYDGLDFSIPIVVYIFVIAVGTDYNILMATRLREEFQQRCRATRGGPDRHCRRGACRDGGRRHSGGDIRLAAADRDPAPGRDRRRRRPRRPARLQRAGDPHRPDPGRLAGLPLLVAAPHAHQDGDRPGRAGVAPQQPRAGRGIRRRRTGLVGPGGRHRPGRRRRDVQADPPKGDGWLKMTARLTILPSRTLK